MILYTYWSILFKKKVTQFDDLREYNKHIYSNKGEGFVWGKINWGQRRPYFNVNKSQNKGLFLLCVLLIDAIDDGPSAFLLLQHSYASVIRTWLICFHVCLLVSEHFEGSGQALVLSLTHIRENIENIKGFGPLHSYCWMDQWLNVRLKYHDNFMKKCGTERLVMSAQKIV